MQIAKYLHDAGQEATFCALSQTCREIHITIGNHQGDFVLRLKELVPFLDPTALTTEETALLAHLLPHSFLKFEPAKWTRPSFDYADIRGLRLDRVLPLFCTKALSPMSVSAPFRNVACVALDAHFMRDIGWYRFGTDKTDDQEIKELVRMFDSAFLPGFGICVQSPLLCRTKNPLRHFGFEAKPTVDSEKLQAWHPHGQRDIDCALKTLSELCNLGCLFFHGIEVGFCPHVCQHGSTVIDFKEIPAHASSRTGTTQMYPILYKKARFWTINKLAESLCGMPNDWTGRVTLINVHLLTHPTGDWDDDWRQMAKVDDGHRLFFGELAAWSKTDQEAAQKAYRYKSVVDMYDRGQLKFVITTSTGARCPCCCWNTAQISKLDSPCCEILLVLQ